MTYKMPTHSLTTGANSFTGKSGNDTFDGALNSTGAQTLTSIDSLDGGAGTDTLVATIAGASSYSPTLTNIEKLVTTFTNTGTLNMTNATGVTSIEVTGSSASGNFTNIPFASGLTLNVNGSTDQSVGFDFKDTSVVGTTDAITLTVADLAKSTTAGTITTTGIETVNIVSNGDSNTFTLADGDATVVNVTGAGSLNLGTVPSTAKTVNASGMTGGLTVTGGSSTSNTITGGSGNDSLTGAGGNDVIAAGDGDNTIVAGGGGNDRLSATSGTNTFSFATAGEFTSADTVTGGSGSDTLSVASADVVSLTSTTVLTNVSGVEKIKLNTALGSGATLNTAYVQAGITGVTLSGGTAGAGTINLEAGTKTVTLGATTTTPAADNKNLGDLTINDTGVATNDVLTVSAGSATNSVNGNSLLINGFETVTYAGSSASQTINAITVYGDSSSAGTYTAATLNLTGSGSITTTATTGVITLGASTGAGVINASAMTKNFVMGAAAVGVTSIAGGSGNDTLIGNTTGTSTVTSTISGGAGNDSITGGQYNDSIDGGTGADTVVGSTGNDNITLGDGNDQYQTTAANLAINTTISGGDGTDSVYFTNNASVADTAFTSKTSLETVTSSALGMGGGASSYVALGTYAAAAGVNTVTFAGTASSAYDSVSFGSTFTNNLTVNMDAAVTSDSNKVYGSGYTKVLTVNVTDATTLTAGVATITGGSGTSDTLNLVAGSYTSTNLGSVTAIENINITNPTSGATNASLQLAVGNASSGKTLTISSSAIVDSSKSVTIDGTLVTAGKLVVTGSVGADTLTGSASATDGDSLTGGAGNDTFSFNYAQLSSSDTVVGGEGTHDVVQITGAGGTVTDTAFTNVSGVEDLTYSAAETITLGAYAAAAGIANVVDTSDAVTLTLGAGFTNNMLIALDAGSDTVDASLYTGNLSVTSTAANVSSADTLTAGVGTSDTLTLTFANSSFTLPSTVTGFESIKSATNVATGTITIGDTAIATGKAATFDFSANTTTAVTLTAANETDGSFTFIGGGTGDSVTISGSSYGDSINMGAGDDTITVSSANYLTANDTIIGGDGSDTLAIAVASTTSDASFTNISTIEKVTLTGANTLVAGAFFQAAGAVTITGSDAAADTITIGSGVTRNLTVDLGTASAGAAYAESVVATGYTGNLTVKATAITGSSLTTDTGYSAIDSTDTLTGGSGTDTLTVTFTSGTKGAALTSAQLANVTKFEVIKTGSNVAGTITLNDANAVDSSIKIDASANTSTNFTLDASNEDDSTLVYVGGNGVNTVMGTAKGDTITGGTGADSINGGAGNDSISGGAGDDTIWGGLGVDTMSGGAGSDTFQINSTGFETGTLSPAVVYYGGVVASGSSVSTAGFDKITDFGAGDKLYVGGQVASTTSGTNGVDLTWTDQAGLLRGTYSASANTFTFSTTGTDSIYAYDFDGSSTTNDIRAVVLVGYVDSGAADTMTTGLVGTA